MEKEYYPQNFSPKEAKWVEIVFAKQDASRNAIEVQTLLLRKPVKKFAIDKDEGVFLQLVFGERFRNFLRFAIAGIVFAREYFI